MTARVVTGDCREVLAGMEPESVDACVTDPPYGLEFMGAGWDRGVPGIEFWAAVYRVLKPGAWLLAFGGTRTYHRMVCAIEDAGFEIRDQIGWAYGSGFPKSLDVAKAIDKAAGTEGESVAKGAPVKRMIPGADQNRTGSWIKDNGREYQPADYRPGEAGAAWQGWGTALKPAWEPICVARKPLIGTVAENVLEYGTGVLNIDATRVPTDGEANPSIARRQGAISHLSNRPAAETEAEGRMVSRQSPEAYRAARAGEALGRWPANIVISYPEDEYELRVDVTAEQRRELFRWLHENA